MRYQGDDVVIVSRWRHLIISNVLCLARQTAVASLDLHVTTLTLSLILTLTLQPYPNPTDPNRDPEVQI